MKALLFATLLLLVSCSHVNEQSEPAFLSAGPTARDAFAEHNAFPDRPEFQVAYFEYNRSRLTAEARKIVTANGDWLLTHPETKIQLEGHCDRRGSDKFNLRLGEKRTDSVRALLVEMGVTEDRITTISHGSFRDLAVDKPHLHRRVVFKFIATP